MSDALGVKGCSLCTRKSEGDQEDLGNTEHCGGHEERVKVEARLKGWKERSGLGTAREECEREIERGSEKRKEVDEGDRADGDRIYTSPLSFVTEGPRSTDLRPRSNGIGL